MVWRVKTPENGGFDVRWVRFPKHILLFSTLSQLDSGGSEGKNGGVFFFARRLLQLGILALWPLDSFGFFLVDFWAACHTNDPLIPRWFPWLRGRC